MRYVRCLASALLAVAALAGGPAFAAGMCQTDHLTCASAMPVGGYCECTSRGNTEGGTIVTRPISRRSASSNATAGGCGAQPNSPGCR
jgi:hypothetical protein